MFPTHEQPNTAAELRTLPMIDPDSDGIFIGSLAARQSKDMVDPNMRFQFACRRWTLGLVWWSFCIVCIGLGVALIAQLSDAPRVANQLLICASFMLGIGIYAAYKGISELSSILEINARGITSRTLFAEKNVLWACLQSYSVRYSSDLPWESAIVVWIDDPEDRMVELPTHGLTETDHVLIRSIIGLHAPRRCA